MKKKIDLESKTVANMKKYIKNQNFDEDDKVSSEQQWIDILGFVRSTIREAAKTFEYSQFWRLSKEPILF